VRRRLRALLALFGMPFAVALATYIAGEPTEAVVLRSFDAEGAHETRAGHAQAVIAEPQREPEVRAAVDSAFRAKYGVTDWWYGVLLRRDAIPIRSTPAP
jgi:hypothetical protein